MYHASPGAAICSGVRSGGRRSSSRASPYRSVERAATAPTATTIMEPSRSVSRSSSSFRSCFVASFSSINLAVGPRQHLRLRLGHSGVGQLLHERVRVEDDRIHDTSLCIGSAPESIVTRRGGNVTFVMSRLPFRYGRNVIARACDCAGRHRSLAVGVPCSPNGDFRGVLRPVRKRIVRRPILPRPILPRLGRARFTRAGINYHPGAMQRLPDEPTAARRTCSTFPKSTPWPSRSDRWRYAGTASPTSSASGSGGGSDGGGPPSTRGADGRRSTSTTSCSTSRSVRCSGGASVTS